MNHRSRMHTLLPLLAVCVAVALATTAPVQAATTGSLQINFGNAPHWSTVQGTHVRRMRTGEGPDYDMFRYGGSYYAYNNDQWYRSRTVRGRYEPIDERYVPGDFRRVPRQHWRHYPSRWSDQNDGRPGRGHDNGPGGPPGQNRNHK